VLEYWSALLISISEIVKVSPLVKVKLISRIGKVDGCGKPPPNEIYDNKII